MTECTDMQTEAILENALLQLLGQLKAMFELTAGMLHRQRAPGSPEAVFGIVVCSCLLGCGHF